jgi:hypothetical protein
VLRNSVVAFNTASRTAGGIYTYGGPVDEQCLRSVDGPGRGVPSR